MIRFSNHGECARLLTENEAGSIPATGAILMRVGGKEFFRGS